MRIAAHQRRIESDLVEHHADVFDLLLRGDQAVNDGRFADDVDNAHPRIERCVRILEDHLHLELRAARCSGAHPFDWLTAPQTLS